MAKIDKIRSALLRYVEADASGKPKYGRVAELSRDSGVDISTLSKLLKKGTPTTGTLFKLAKVIGKELEIEGLAISDHSESYENSDSIPAANLSFVKKIQRMTSRRAIEEALLEKLHLLPEAMVAKFYSEAVDFLDKNKKD